MSLLWVNAAKPRQTGKMPVEHGLFYRLHPKSRPFSREDASSEAFYKPDEYHYDDPDWDDEAREQVEHMRSQVGPRPGYSAYRDPHHVHQYAEARGLNTHDSDVVAFHGTVIGHGNDDESLVLPHHDRPHQRIPYDQFVRRLRRSPKPDPLDLDEHDDGGWGGGW